MGQQRGLYNRSCVHGKRGGWGVGLIGLGQEGVHTTHSYPLMVGYSMSLILYDFTQTLRIGCYNNKRVILL